MAIPKVLFVMADYGHDPTETSIPYSAFKKAGFEVSFATENGKPPVCDAKMLTGITQKLLGATQETITFYDSMIASPEHLHPIPWTDPAFSLEQYDLIFLPGGHDKGVRQVIDSPIIAKHLGSYFPSTAKPSSRNVAAVCHGVMVLAAAKLLEGENKGKSVIHECDTTALPARFEQMAYYGTKLFLGDYYKTYGAGSEDVEDSVRKCLDDPDKQYKNSLGMNPFVVENEKYNYSSARFPGDAVLLSERVVAMVTDNMKV